MAFRNQPKEHDASVESLRGDAYRLGDLLDLDETILRLKPLSRHHVEMRAIPVVGRWHRRTGGDLDRRSFQAVTR
jgi:hypothetical protein